VFFERSIEGAAARRKCLHITATAVCVFALVFVLAGKRKSSRKSNKSDCVVGLFSDSEFSLKSYVSGAAGVIRALYGCQTPILEAAPLTNYRGDLPIHPETIAEAAIAGVSSIVEVEPSYDELRGEGLQGYQVTVFALPTMDKLFSSLLPIDGRFEPLLKRQLKKEKIKLDELEQLGAVGVADYLNQAGSLKSALRVYEHVSENAAGLDPAEVKRALEQIASLKTKLGQNGKSGKLPALGSFVHVEYGAIRRGYKDAFNASVDQVDMSDYLAGISSSPAVLILQPVDGDDSRLKLVLKVEFDAGLYWQSVADKPKIRSGLRIVHLKPFHNLMYRVLRLQGAFLDQLGEVERKRITKLKGTLLLVRSDGMEAEIPINVGKTSRKLLQPSKIWLRESPKAKKMAFEAASKRIFDRYGEFAVGKTKTKAGQPTRWLVVDRFFELSKHS
jgi:hypothetical protein